MIVSVKNFGQIASASIDMSTFSLFVGHNNSGKTLMMQLIYGVIDYLTRRIDISEHYTFGELPITIDNTNFPEIETAVNKVLHEKKDEIVFNTFKRRIPIEELWVEFGEIGNTFLISAIEKSDMLKINLRPDISFHINSHNYVIYTNENDFQMFSNLVKGEVGFKITNLHSNYLAKSILGKLILNTFAYFDTVFLPASRTGIQLLYKFFFISLLERNESITNSNSQNENEYGLTQPVYDFLMFLQKHINSEGSTEKNAHLTRFIEDNLISGKLSIINNEMHYSPKSNPDLLVPPQLSSSMVNEFAPLMRVLTGIKQPHCIFYDEVETCLHPLKQIEMARLLVRMVNADYKMIVSTHSDTMAAAIDNLILLSAAKDRDEKAKKLGYDENDFLKPEKLGNVHVYQFIVDDSTGKTTVEELENYLATGIGYDFELFQQSNNRLYHDASIIMDMDGE